MVKNIEHQKCQKMAEEIDAIFPLDMQTKKAFSSIKRELFVPPGFKHLAYKLDALPIFGNQWISSPLTVAKMTTYLEIDKDTDSVLEIGCGSGYQAAILSKLVRRVFTIERIQKLSIEAKERIKNLGIHNIHIRCDDGQNGWRSYAPYDRILFSATAKNISDTILDQLKEGGILIVPIEKNGKHIITKFKKNNTSIEKIELEESTFVPVLNGIQKAL